MPEQCNGIDDDCDGEVDENLVGAGDSCERNDLAGPCRPGTRQCVEGTWNCVPNLPPTPETCNNLDDDCDGQVDEDLAETGASCTANQPGECQQGSQLCENGGWICVPGVAAPERCNGLDDDCDGLVDNASREEGQGCVTYLGAPGLFSCQQGSLVCEDAPSETCNGLDDNGNGVIDEGNPGGGAPCSVSGASGPCANGLTNCMTGSLVCRQQVAPTVEVCDGLDNNCDGVVDDGNPEGGASCQTTLNEPGTITCTNGALSCEAVIPEVCNGLDDNGNGQIDEGNPGGGQACVVSGAQGVCADGLTDCVAGSLDCSPTVSPSIEICDGLDNNCNGMADEGIAPAQCIVPGAIGVCAEGSTSCLLGVEQCQGPSPTTEVCDGLDNNCNGAIDEGIPSADCVVPGAQGVCAAGTSDCVAGVEQCQGPPATPEVCNGLDDNCNGVIDDGVDGAPCNTGQSQPACQTGTRVCIGGQLSCQPPCGCAGAGC